MSALCMTADKGVAGASAPGPVIESTITLCILNSFYSSLLHINSR